MDVEDILGLHAYFMGTIASGLGPSDFHSGADFADETRWTPGRRIRFSAGWGTSADQRFSRLPPQREEWAPSRQPDLQMTEADGRPAVKLSDNYAKATGLRSEIARYRRVFGTAGVANIPVLV